MADETKPESEVPGAPAIGAKPTATPHVKPAVAPRPAAAALPDLAGKTTSVASVGGAAAKAATTAAAAKATTRDADDT